MAPVDETETVRSELVVVDDHPENLELLMRILTSKGYLVRAFPDAELALSSMNVSVPDLILLDIGLPGIDGFEACRRLRCEERTRDVPVIFLSARTDVEDIIHGFDVGGSDYVTKPIRERELLARIRVHVQVKQLQDKLRRLSTIDALTGLNNRRALDEHLFSEWRRNQRQRTWLGAIVIDIDHFKQYNDNYGHQKGDLCLRSVAHAIAAAARRSGDFVARYGGEEFAVLLPNTELSGTRLVADRIRAGVNGLRVAHEHSSTAPFVTASLGATSMVPGRDVSPGTLIDIADRYLYAAKRLGRNCVVSAEPLELASHSGPEA